MNKYQVFIKYSDEGTGEPNFKIKLGGIILNKEIIAETEEDANKIAQKLASEINYLPNKLVNISVSLID